ncbi:MAG: T9SS type A sorting domain-containing protein [Bacteroidetes bacterium]|nr:T9SS type A sorting domain-containing protein [Bacteroidota bacterium]
MKICFFIFALILSSEVFPADTVSVKYFPLKAGNTWYYKTTSSPIPFPPVFHKDYIEKDTSINGITYFKFYKYYSLSFIRIDSVNGNLLAYSPGNGCGSYANDKIIDSLASSPGNQITCIYENIQTRRCVSTGTQNVFGIISDTKDFDHYGLFVATITYAKNFGVIGYCSGDPPPCTAFTNLIGCRIDGIVYGDTNLTSIEQFGNPIPEYFSLKQNFPNPFNPLTIINYQLAINNVVSLKVYDALGIEVVTLVNEKQDPGRYSVEFSGEGLPSGIYFYKLEAGDFTETKRMVLLK